MDFVDDQHRFIKAETAHEFMAHRQHREQNLIDGTDANLPEEDALAAAGEPGGALHAGLDVALAGATLAAFDELLEACVEIAFAVREHDVGASVNLGGKGFHALEHGIGGGLRRQGEDDAVGHAHREQAPGVGQRGFGLATAGGCFDQGQAGGSRQGIDLCLHAARASSLASSAGNPA